MSGECLIRGFMYLICTRSNHGGNILGKSDMTAPTRFGLLWDNGQRECIATGFRCRRRRGLKMARIDLRGAELSAARLYAAARWRRRGRGGAQGASDVDAVAERGAEAALEYGEEFDGVRPAGVRVPAEKLDGALADLDPSVRTALEVAIERARAVHADQRRADTTTLDPVPR